MAEEREEYLSRTTGKIRKRRKDGWARRNIETFLAHLRVTGNLTTSAAAAGKRVRGVFALRDIDAAFAADVDRALQESLVRIRSKAIVYAETQGKIPPPREDGEPAEAPMETFEPNFALKLLAHERDRREGFRPKGGPRPKCISKEALVQTLAKLFDMVERRQARRAG
jgi:hypothetical protein